jgi:hypothetical protein
MTRTNGIEKGNVEPSAGKESVPPLKKRSLDLRLQLAFATTREVNDSHYLDGAGIMIIWFPYKVGAFHAGGDAFLVIRCKKLTA